MNDYLNCCLKPDFAAHRKNEAFRGHFVDGLDAKDAASRFEDRLGSFRNLGTGFGRNPDMSGLFAERKPGPKHGGGGDAGRGYGHAARPAADRVRQFTSASSA